MTKKRTTQSYTQPPRPPAKRRAHTRGGKRRGATAEIVLDGTRSVVVEDVYTPDGSDPDDT